MYPTLNSRVWLLWAASAAALAGGCAFSNHPVLDIQRRQTEEIKKLTVAIEAVTNADSAQAQLPAIRDAFRALAKIKREFPPLIRKHAQDRINKASADQVQLEGVQAELGLEQAMGRLNSIKNLPESFCSMLRLESARFAVATSEAVASMRNIPGVPTLPNTGDISTLKHVVGLYEKHGPAKVAELTLVNAGQANSSDLADAAGGNASCKIIRIDNNTSVATVAPVDDFDAFCTQIADLGTVSQREDNMRELTLTLASFGAASGTARGKTYGTPRHTTPSKPNSPDLADMADMPDMPDMPDMADTLDGLRKTNPEVMREFDKHMPSMLNDNKDLEPVNPDDYARLAAMLTDSSPITQEEAAARLLTVDPKEVTDPDLRKRIARGYRSMVLHNPHDQEVAVEGLVHWAGKFSVPVLVQIMDRERLRIDEHIFNALATLKDPKGAEAVARQLGNFFNHDEAVAALRQMGPAAEDALIDVAPSDDPKASLAAVTLLGDVGTPKSYDLLRQAMRSGNRDVKEAARTSLKKIRSREGK